jgi:hypothetical protein
MTLRMHRWVAPALLAVAIPTLALAQQAQTPEPAQPPAKSDQQRPRLSPEARGKLVDGRMAMIKETLKLDAAQLKLWEPVEAQMRAESTALSQRWTERRQARQQEQRRSPADRLDHASEALARRAADMKAFANVFRPFYASLSDEQKVLSRIVLREGRGHGGRGHHRWANR